MKLDELSIYVHSKHGIHKHLQICHFTTALRDERLERRVVPSQGESKWLYWRKCTPCQRNEQMTRCFFRLEGWVFFSGHIKIFSWSFLYPLGNILRQHLQEYIKQHLQAWKTHNMGLSSQSLICSSLRAQHIFMKHRKPHLYG